MVHITAKDADLRSRCPSRRLVRLHSQLTGDDYRSTMSAYPYREQSDLVVVAPDGQ
jgi:hypothetical protein